MISNIAGPPVCVIPAQAGIQDIPRISKPLDPGFHRGDDFLRDHQRCDAFASHLTTEQSKVGFARNPNCPLVWGHGGGHSSSLPCLQRSVFQRTSHRGTCLRAGPHRQAPCPLPCRPRRKRLGRKGFPQLEVQENQSVSAKPLRGTSPPRDP